MVIIKTSVELKFKDYFDKYGFGDGQGPDEAIAEDFKDLACKCLNDALGKFKLGGKFQAEEYDPGSGHNNCRILLKQAFEDDPIYVVSNSGLISFELDGSLPAAVEGNLRRVIDYAEKLFEAKAK